MRVYSARQSLSGIKLSVMNGGALGVRELGTALVVISDSMDSWDKGRSGLVSDHYRSIEVDYQSGAKPPHSKGYAEQSPCKVALYELFSPSFS